jgi:hypothetical protein
MPERRDLPLYAFDIETTGLFCSDARVTTVAVYSPDVSFVIEDNDERRLITALGERFASLPAGVVCTWNGAVFDGPFLTGRSRRLGIGDWFRLRIDRTIVPKYEPQPGFAPEGLHPLFPAADTMSDGGNWHDHLDAAYLWKDWAQVNDVKWELKPVARANGLDVIEVDREHMDALSVAERMAYNLSDVVATYQLAGGPHGMGRGRAEGAFQDA